jgi:hypothetical protein
VFSVALHICLANVKCLEKGFYSAPDFKIDTCLLVNHALRLFRYLTEFFTDF